MKRKIIALLMALTMFTLLACSLLTGSGEPNATEMVETQMAMLPYTTVIRSTKTPTTTITPTNNMAPTNTVTPANTSAPVVTPTESCMLWSEVSAEMAGEYKCVRGDMVSTYQAENGTYIRFSTQSTSFYFIYLYLGNTYFYYPDLKTGDCVQAYGTILAYQGVPRIEISGKLDLCD